ncbi:MAG: glycosyltransferase family 2 protein [Candidatus Acidiferrales bacterium]|jgi:cellulose synthase/poly-beta-1,6-N-acetylglucosamine synthase-like glycosyltransferase
MIYPLFGIVLLICIYTMRHYLFTLNRLFGFQRHPYIDIDTADWPPVTVLVAAHNEEKVVAHILTALMKVSYPEEKLLIVPVNDRSTDRTREIIDTFVQAHPGRIRPFHRTGGKGGKAAALKDAMGMVETEVILIFDADYIPGTALVKQLVAPFFDPEVGGVMGRVVPLNVGRNLLTRLLDLERAGGYQVDQQARMNLRLVPQHGGTVAGVRLSALREIGGWNENSLTEDTDLTYRLLLAGWKTVYQNRSECYEEVPETWPVRIKQIQRWAKGHNQALANYGFRLLFGKHLATSRERVDGFLLLGVYMMAPITMLAWILALAVFYQGTSPLHGIIAVLSVTAYAAVGNFAAFFEIAAAARLDSTPERIRLLPLLIFAFLVSIVAVSRAVVSQLTAPLTGAQFHWDKTERFRSPS